MQAELDQPVPSWLPEPHGPGNLEYERWVLHARYALTGRQEDLQRLVDEYRAYTSSLARRYVRNGEPLEDLHQVACEALIVALKRYDPHRGVRFLAFATPTIAGALKRHFRDLGWSMRVPRRVHEVVGPARVAADGLTAQLGRKPTVAEVAVAIGVDEETLLLANDAAAARNLRSLDAPDDDRAGTRAPGAADGGYERTEERMVLVEAFSTLPAADRDLVELYYFRGLSQSAIASRTGVSQMQVSRLLSRAVGRLRTTMVA